MTRLFFAPDGKKHGDFCLIEKDGVLHNIFIENVKGEYFYHDGLSNGNSFGIATSRDGLLWEYGGKIKDPGKAGSWNDKSLWAMHIIKNPLADRSGFDGEFLMAYTAIATMDGLNHPSQQMGLATSDDLRAWKDCSKNPVIRNSDTGVHYYPMTVHRFCWRDVNIFSARELGKDDDGFYAILAAKDLAVPFEIAGCTALLYSKDLKSWETRLPVFSPSRYNEVETPHVVSIDGRYALIFGENALSMSMRFALGQGPLGPFTEPELNVFTPANCYSGMVISFRGDNLFYHWVMDRHMGKNERYLCPPKLINLKDDFLFLYKHPRLSSFFREIGEGDVLRELGAAKDNRVCFTKRVDGKSCILQIRSKDELYSKDVYFTLTGCGISVRDFSTSQRFNESRTVPVHPEKLELEIFMEGKFMEVYVGDVFIYTTALSESLEGLESFEIVLP